MASNQSPKGKIVEKYLDDYPEMPSLTMAKIIARDHPMDFASVEATRTLIRAYRGKIGDGGRAHNYGNRKHYKNTKEPNFAPYAMPQPESEDFTPIELPVAQNNIGIISDFHIPNHRQEPIEIALRHLKEQEINTLILNGDILDNTPFTRHDGKRPSAGDVRRWFDQTEFFLEWIRELFPEATIYWTEGNHDYWYRRWMQAHAWQLDDDPYFSLQERLHLDEYKIKYIPQERYLLAGKLAIMHGHQIAGRFGVGVMPARSLYLKTKKSAIIGHVHVESSYTDNDLSGEITTCWSTGCMCTLTPVYNPVASKACHGFAHVVVNKDKSFNLKNYRIYKNRIL